MRSAICGGPTRRWRATTAPSPSRRTTPRRTGTRAWCCWRGATSRAAWPNTNGGCGAVSDQRDFAQPQWLGERHRRQDHPAACRAGLRRHHPVRALRAVVAARGARVRAGGAGEPEAAAVGIARRVGHRQPRRAAAAVRPALPADEPAAGIQDRRWTRCRRPRRISMRRATASRQWRPRLPGEGLKVGLAWSGSPTHKNDHNRSIALEQAGAAACATSESSSSACSATCATATLKILQALAERRGARARRCRISPTPRPSISLLDLVISVDTGVAHLAGALGKPVWILLPFIGEWRWLESRDDSPWYPTARLFRQPKGWAIGSSV